MFFKFIAFLAFKPSERINSNPFITFMTDGSVSVANNVLPPNFVWQMWTLSRITLISSSRYCVLLPPSHIIICRGGRVCLQITTVLVSFRSTWICQQRDNWHQAFSPQDFSITKKCSKTPLRRLIFTFFTFFIPTNSLSVYKRQKIRGGGWLCWQMKKLWHYLFNVETFIFLL